MLLYVIVVLVYVFVCFSGKENDWHLEARYEERETLLALGEPSNKLRIEENLVFFFHKKKDTIILVNISNLPVKYIVY